MPKFRVPMTQTITAYVNVEADDEDSAVDKAFEHAPEFCAQCQGWGQSWSIEFEDWDGSDEAVEELDEDAKVVNED